MRVPQRAVGQRTSSEQMIAGVGMLKQTFEIAKNLAGGRAHVPLTVTGTRGTAIGDDRPGAVILDLPHVSQDAAPKL